MGKVASSSVPAIILNPQFDTSDVYFVISGAASMPPG